MHKLNERLKEIEQRKEALRNELKAGAADEARTIAIREEAEALATEEKEIRDKLSLNQMLAPGTAVAPAHQTEDRADNFVRTNRMTIPMFVENRSVLISSGKLATPTAVSQNLSELPTSVSSIVDDVDVIDATGTGTWRFPYRKTDAVAATKTEGAAAGGTAGTFDFVDISPASEAVLDEISNQVKKQSPVLYQASVQNNAYLALRRKAKAMITNKIVASNLTEAKTYALDANYVRSVVLGFGSDESVGGGTKLYIRKEDLADLGKIRGTNEKKPVFDITYTDENNGIIKDGGLALPFSINSTLTKGQQLYGQPKAAKLLLWGDYEVSTDDGGDYFKRSMLGIKGEVTAGADLTVYHGFQLISNSANSAS